MRATDPCGPENVRSRRGLRAFHLGVRFVALDGLERRSPRDSGGGRHGLGVRAPDAGADRDPRSHARPRLRGVQPVHRRVERTGRIRIRRHGAPAWPGRLGDFRRLRRHPRDAHVGGNFPGSAQGGQAGIVPSRQ
jgi:hypothetical protein